MILLNANLDTTTLNGGTCTNNGDGTYTLNGTASNRCIFRLASPFKLKSNTYRLIFAKTEGDVYLTFSKNNYASGDVFTTLTDKTCVLSQDITAYFYIDVEVGKTLKNKVVKPMLTTDINATYDDFEKYKGEQTATLPYTLNAIPVSEGGNVTIDGQRYIADYVDIEKKILVRNVGDVDLGSFNYLYHNNDGQYCFFTLDIQNAKGSSDYGTSIANGLCNIYRKENWINNRTGSDYDNTFAIAPTGSISIRNSSYTDVTTFKEAMSGAKLLYELATPTIIDLTDEEVQAFKELHTYYPATNIINSSDQLDGFTTFNYPVSLKNGWEYVKQQIGDTREYIYDMELQAAEAYVNSEYAVTLTELGV